MKAIMAFYFVKIALQFEFKMTNIELQKELAQHPDDVSVLMVVLTDSPGPALGTVDFVIPKLSEKGGYLVLKEFIG